MPYPISAGAPPQTPLGSALDPLAGFKGRISIGEGKDQEAVAVIEGARGLNLALAPIFVLSPLVL